MKTTAISLALAAIVTFGVVPACAQSLDAIERAENGVMEAWAAAPLTFRRTIFVSEPPQAFGVFSERKDALFANGEPIVVYAEPVGYAWQENGDGTYTFGFDVDLLVKTADGQIVGGQENFDRLEFTSRVRNREFMLTLTLDLSGAPPDDYVLQYRVRDIASDKAGTISLPFSLAEQAN